MKSESGFLNCQKFIIFGERLQILQIIPLIDCILIYRSIFVNINKSVKN